MTSIRFSQIIAILSLLTETTFVSLALRSHLPVSKAPSSLFEDEKKSIFDDLSIIVVITTVVPTMIIMPRKMTRYNSNLWLIIYQ